HPAGEHVVIGEALLGIPEGRLLCTKRMESAYGSAAATLSTNAVTSSGVSRAVFMPSSLPSSPNTAHPAVMLIPPPLAYSRRPALVRAAPGWATGASAAQAGTLATWL